MNKIKRVLAMAIVGTLAFSAVGCKMIQRTDESIQKTVLAKVGDVKITKADLDNMIQPYMDQYAQQYGADFENDEALKAQVLGLKEEAMGILVDEEILVQKAKELNLVPEQAELDKQVEEIKTREMEQFGGEEGFKTALAEANLTEEDYKEFNERRIITQLVMDDIVKDVAVTDEDVKKYYDENTIEFKGSDISHILVTDEAQAKEIKEKLNNGGNFEELAKEFSMDGSKEKGGSLGFTMYNTLVPEFVEGLGTIKEGEISEPIKSQFGYHIIKFTGEKVTPFEESKEELKTKLESEQKAKLYDETLAKWNTELNVKIYTDKL
ncbi:MAG: peptidylprolyl isomerase [Terrisporobacter sp.]